MAKIHKHIDIQKETEKHLGTFLHLAALIVVRRAKQLCPVRTGSLRRSITHLVDRPSRTAIVGSNMEYAAHVELGTSKMKARPYLTPALEQSRDEVTAILKLGAK